MATAVPLIKVADNADPSCVRRPDDEMDSCYTLNCPEMGTHRVIGFEEGALGEEVQFKVGEEGWKSIGIVPFRDLSLMVCHAEPIGAGSEWSWDNRFEQPCFMQARHGNGTLILSIEE